MSIALLIFAIASVFVLYVIAGYPLLLRVLSRSRRQNAAPAGGPLPAVTVLLPVKNGEMFLESKIRNLRALQYPSDRLQIVVISDGSTDATDEIARRYESLGLVEFLRVESRGKAGALNAGLSRVRGEVILFTDVRQTIEAGSLRSMVAHFADPGIGAVTGELIILDGETHEEQSAGLYWHYEKWVRRQLNAWGSLLVVTGCIYALRRDLAIPIPEDMLTDDAFLPVHVLEQGYRIAFDEQAKAYDYPTKFDIEFHRKIRTLAGLYQMVARKPKLVNLASKLGFHFFSYKVSRLLLPYAFLALLLSSPFLPMPWNALVTSGQLALYGLALADRAIPNRHALKRFSGAAHAFLMLMVASVRAVRVFFVPPQNMWKVTQVQTAAATVVRARGTGA